MTRVRVVSYKQSSYRTPTTNLLPTRTQKIMMVCEHPPLSLSATALHVTAHSLRLFVSHCVSLAQLLCLYPSMSISLEECVCIYLSLCDTNAVALYVSVYVYLTSKVRVFAVAAGVTNTASLSVSIGVYLMSRVYPSVSICLSVSLL